MSKREDIIERAKELTEPHERRFHDKLDEVHWVEKDDCSCDGDYCSECIENALYERRRKYLLEQRKRPISLRDKVFSKFEYTYNYGGGYEYDSFACCESCGKPLEICILPNKETLDEILEELKCGIINDELGWKCHWLLYNAWEDERHKECNEPTLTLAQRVIEILNP